MKQVLTWSQIQRQFLTVAKDYPTLSAQWREVFQTWILRPDMLRAVPGDFPESSQQFKATATAAVTRLRKKSRQRKPWQLWLDLLRKHLESRGLGDRRTALEVDTSPETRDIFGEPGRFTECGCPIFVSYREWHLMQASGESLQVIRHRPDSSTMEALQSDGLHLRHPDGRLALDGIIACVPQTSADFARYLKSVESSSNATRRQKFMKPYIYPAPRKPTLTALGKRLGIEQSSFSRWYRGESRLSDTNRDRLAKYLGVVPKTIPN